MRQPTAPTKQGTIGLFLLTSTFLVSRSWGFSPPFVQVLLPHPFLWCDPCLPSNDQGSNSSDFIFYYSFLFPWIFHLNPWLQLTVSYWLQPWQSCPLTIAPNSCWTFHLSAELSPELTVSKQVSVVTSHTALVLYPSVCWVQETVKKIDWSICSWNSKSSRENRY